MKGFYNPTRPACETFAAFPLSNFHQIGMLIGPIRLPRIALTCCFFLHAFAFRLLLFVPCHVPACRGLFSRFGGISTLRLLIFIRIYASCAFSQCSCCFSRSTPLICFLSKSCCRWRTWLKTVIMSTMLGQFREHRNIATYLKDSKERRNKDSCGSCHSFMG